MMTSKDTSTPPIKVDKNPSSTPGGLKVSEEKIYVTVRVRPLSEKEQMINEEIVWECSDDHTILFKNAPHERLNTYTFDKVFGPACSTEKVYEEGVKDVALSSLTGINATIFAYGQTSSGKTFTMKGITKSAINDIYKHIENNPERDFIIKISALEIYNETVMDLLNPETGPLRLLDDPERGTVIDKLVEEIPKDCQELQHFINLCEAQRQVGETILNDSSSRSHQILRLTVESSVRENMECIKSYIATLNFVDLAGSERALQTLSSGTRLKEGSHINRSLLTLTTVIRKLSGGRRGHIPYRDSKLTRILQTSLGGNARTAIICTMSPALGHAEQSRNTLLFAGSAKEVTNRASVNMVVSERQLVKHLQKEVARLEAECLRSPETPLTSSNILLMEKDLRIKQLEMEVEAMKHQRDIAQSHVIELQRKAQQNNMGMDFFKSPSGIVKCLSFSGEKRSKKIAKVSAKTPVTIVQEIQKLEQMQKQLAEEAKGVLDVLHKEVTCHRLGSQDAAETILKLLAEVNVTQIHNRNDEVGGIFMKHSSDVNLKEKITQLNTQGSAIFSLEQQLEKVQKSIDQLVLSQPSIESSPISNTESRKKKMLPFALHNNVIRQKKENFPCSPLSSSEKVTEREIENRDPENDGLVQHIDATPTKGNSNDGAFSGDNTPGNGQSSSVSVKKMQKMFKNAFENNYQSIKAYVVDLKERIEKLRYQKELLVSRVLALEANEDVECEMEAHDSLSSWHLDFEDKRKQIIMLWHLCHISIVHRTQFYLLFTGDSADQTYMEVELNRLTWLEQYLAELGNASPALLGDQPANYVFSSVKALKQERESLAKKVNSQLTPEEREMLYRKWEIPLDGKQRRRLQLVDKLWSDPKDMQHAQESAEVVAKLLGFFEDKDHISKEMFTLSFVPPVDKKSWLPGWNAITNFLHL
ncbi:kinesin-like protein KIN-7A [Aristolochia californica]|uniref:kinesin-like protein KIN-7A n=1 Tax=Aristolochia californica TaxID=171875 RepID=UPI0035E2618C